MNRTTRALYGALALGGCLLAAAPAAAATPAEEFKLILTPEPGQPPPARVCLASRSGPMRAGRAEAAHLVSLAAGAVCDDADCRRVDRSGAGRCGQCPAAAHPDCRARLDPGDRALADYTVVCARDDSAPADGGTIYVAVESVEAESPPELHALEVHGGRVRWSPVGGTRRPSYRVLGGDFVSSRLSYPRRPSDRPWAEVPSRRRCRCLDVMLPVGQRAVDAVTIDDAPVCHGDVGAGDLLPVEVPTTDRGRVRGLRIESADARLELAWSDRWPAVPMTPILTRVRFGWRVPCAWAGGEACPAPRVRGARCRAEGRVDGICRHICRARAPGALASPIDVVVTHDAPPLTWTDVVSAPGDVSTTDVPAADRVVRADVAGWPTTVPGDRIGALEVQLTDGSTRIRDLPPDATQLWIPAPDARCGQALSVRPRGERAYLARRAPIAAGGRLALPPPAALVVPWDLHLTVAGGGGGLSLPAAGGPRILTQFAGFGAVGLRARPAERRWFGDLRPVGGLVSAWAYGALGFDGAGRETRSAPLGLVGAELTAGYSVPIERTAVHLFAGGGPTMALALAPGDAERLPHRDWLGAAVLGAQWPLRVDLDAALHVRVALRAVVGGVVRRFETDFATPSVERVDGAGLLLLTVGLDPGV